ncbi:MAG: hypothetical protein L3J03_03295 [Desulfobacterales bacterium]|nr:hypothetical protein [Desulfobacterales bacterium]
MISSKEIFEKTGISRATLNNYIKLGILPRPIVKRAGAGQQGAKKIGFFPRGVLDRIDRVKQLKRSGFTMDSIARQLSGTISREATPGKAPYELPERRSLETLEQRTQVVADTSAGKPELNLSIRDLDTPAYLINHNFEIEWINSQAEDMVLHSKVGSISESEQRNIFKLFFNWEFQDQVRNWRECIAAHFSFLKSRISRELLTDLFKGIAAREIKVLSDLYDRVDGTTAAMATASPVTLEMKDGSTRSFQIHTMSFREGVFVVYVAADDLNDSVLRLLTQRSRVIRELLAQRMPSLVSLCVLVADLQDSVRISAELPPEEYFELINGLWQTVRGSFEKYGGIHGRHVGDGMLYYFVKKPGTNYLMNAIDCALELRRSMQEFSSRWKVRKNWDNELILNIAINEGQVFFGAIHSAANVEFTALGDSINSTGRLADFARNGSIWTTKNVIGKLESEERAGLRYGVRRQQKDGTVFIPNSFSRVIDLVDGKDPGISHVMDIANLPITEVVEKKS